ncbi:hypothetical protein EG850_04390 [Gulosibacter macacae]|uniref:Uncharacterized protein n=1 Tax=Gulosibacter macacae TaxID=2488791 RepID=A0A3P3VXN4_9MICO|nr:DUF6350 family protein [Gulosibacter macacae]RRJ87545.1 hypothetical protein EG850_04390 [Gulosibacter macacae]
MTRPATLIALLADAVLCALAGIGVPLLIATIGWLSTAGWNEIGWSTLVDIASALWALGLGGGVGITIAPEFLPQLQLAEPFAFVISLAPLAFAILIAWVGWHAGARTSDDDSPWLGLGVGTFAFAIASWLSLQFASPGMVRIDTAGAVITGTLLWLAAMLIGVRVWEFVPWQQWLGKRTDAVMTRLGAALRTGAGLLAGAVALASLLLLVSVFTGMGRVIGLMQALHLDVWGVIALSLVQLAYVPTLISWAISWMLGPGFALGSGSLAGPGGTEAGPLPIAPLMGLIPDALPPVWWAVVVLPLAMAVGITMLARMRTPDPEVAPWWDRFVAPVGGALVAALVLGVLAHLSRGALGPGRLIDFGPAPGWVMLAAFGIFAAGGVIGAYLPLTTVDSDASEQGPGLGARLRGFVFAEGDDEPESAEPEVKAADKPTARVEGTSNTIDLSEVRAERAKREREEARTTMPKVQPREPVAKPAPKEAPRRSKSAPDGDLSDVLRRPDEPDIYADLDDEL